MSIQTQQPVTTEGGKRETTVPTTGLYSTTSNVFSETTHILQKRSQAWEDYEKGRPEQAVRTFNQNPPYDAKKQNGIRTLINFLRNQPTPIEFLVAPYLASAQLVYFLNEGFIDAIYGSFDIFLWPDVEKLITNFDGRGQDGNGSFTWISKQQVLNETNLSHELYVDACILSGSVGFSPYSELLYPGLTPQLLQGVAGGSAAASTAIAGAGDPVAAGLYAPFLPFKVAVSFILNSPAPSVYQMVHMYSEQQERGLVKYVEKYQKTWAAIIFHPVLKENGKVEPTLPESDWPKDIHEVVGQRLPDEIYFYLSHGLIGPELLNCLTSGFLFEPAPLDGGRPTSYRRYLTHVQDEVQSKSFNYIALTLHRYFQSKPVRLVSWFEPSRDHIRRPGSIDNILKKDNWKITSDSLEAPYASKKTAKYHTLLAKLLCLFYEAKDDNPNDIEEFVSATFPKPTRNPSISGSSAPLSGTSTGSGTPNPSGNAVPGAQVPAYIPPSLHSVRELLDNSILRDLQAIGLFDSQHHLTPWGKVIAKALDSLETTETSQYSTNLVEPLLLALLLVRDGFLTAGPLEPGYPGGPNDVKVPDSISAHIMLLSRVASYVSLSHDPTGYTGPLSRTILAFGSIIAKQYSVYRQLVEATVVALLATGEVDRINLKMGDSTSSAASKEVSADLPAVTEVWDNVAPLLPFAQAPNCGTGVAMKMYLERIASSADTTSNASAAITTVASTTPAPNASSKPESSSSSAGNSAKVTKEEVLTDLKQMFRLASDISGDFKKAFVLWKHIYAAVIDAEKAGLVTTSAARSFHEAGKWVEKYSF